MTEALHATKFKQNKAPPLPVSMTVKSSLDEMHCELMGSSDAPYGADIIENVPSGSSVSKLFTALQPKIPGYREYSYAGNKEVFSQSAPTLPQEWPVNMGTNIHIPAKSLVAVEELCRKAVSCASAMVVLALVFREEVSKESPDQKMADRTYEALSKAIRHVIQLTTRAAVNCTLFRRSEALTRFEQELAQPAPHELKAWLYCQPLCSEEKAKRRDLFAGIVPRFKKHLEEHPLKKKQRHTGGGSYKKGKGSDSTKAPSQGTGGQSVGQNPSPKNKSFQKGKGNQKGKSDWKGQNKKKSFQFSKKQSSGNSGTESHN